MLLSIVNTWSSKMFRDLCLKAAVYLWGECDQEGRWPSSANCPGQQRLGAVRFLDMSFLYFVLHVVHPERATPAMR